MIRRWLTPCLMLFAVEACAPPGRLAQPSSGSALIDADLARLRSATRPFQSLDSAVAAGYPREVDACLVHEHHGAMGYHHLNRGYLTAAPPIEKPPILLYERTADGAYRLNGVEFIIPYRLYPRDSVPPVLLGQQLHREDNLNIWYLHVWAWKSNPDGVFANFNPTVSCPGTSGRVYTPFAREP
jgi:hypothetical protein